ncbi:hypothetical protein FRC09_010264, partial [Ceratobasidium sp. 395]
SGGRVQTVREQLDREAVPLDGAPFYCIYGGMIQGIWKRYWNIQLIKGIRDPNLQFCKAHSWDGARYVVSANRSFRDLLFGKHGWPLLYGTPLEVFGDESDFVIGPGLLKELCALDVASPSLLCVIARVSIPNQDESLHLHTQAPSTRHLKSSLSSSRYRQNAIDMDVQMQMMVLDYAVQQRVTDLGLKHEAEVLTRMIDRLSECMSNLAIDMENLADN